MNWNSYVEAVMKVANNEFVENELLCFKKVVNWYQGYCRSIFKNYPYFEIETGKVYGDAMEKLIIKSFPALRKWKEDMSFDAIADDGLKVEIKSLRAEKKESEMFKTLLDRIVSIKTNTLSGFSTTSFQQAKPTCCDLFIYHVLYGDGDRLFMIPSSMVSKRPGKDNKEEGKLPLSVQHRDHPQEGQVNLNQVKKYSAYFEIESYSHDNTYDLRVCREVIIKRMEAIRWRLPEIATGEMICDCQEGA